MRRTCALLACGILTLVLAVPAFADDTPWCGNYAGKKGCAKSGDGGIGVGVGKHGGGHKGEGVGGAGGGPQYQYEFVLTCPTNSPDGPNDPCPPATQSCGRPNLFHYWLYRRPVG